MEYTGPLPRLPTYWVPDHHYDHGSSKLLLLQKGSWDQKGSTPSGATTPSKPHLLAEEHLKRSTLDVYNELVLEEEEQQRQTELRKLLPSCHQPPSLTLFELGLSKVQSLVSLVSLSHHSYCQPFPSIAHSLPSLLFLDDAFQTGSSTVCPKFKLFTSSELTLSHTSATQQRIQSNFLYITHSTLFLLQT